MGDETGIYDAVGGDAPFHELVEAFYRLVEADRALRALYPDDLGPGKEHLAWFLIQRFGGPDHFNRRRGAPRLRARHSEFAITPAMRDAWVRHMAAALGAVDAFAAHRDVMRVYFEDAATFLINRDVPAATRTPLSTL